MKWKQILKNEGLEDWELIISNTTDGLCMHNHKKLFVGKGCNALFLHEVAHAKTYQWNERFGDMTGHHAIWGDEFTRLIKKYMVMVD